MLTDDIEWPDEKEWPVQLESKDLITQLLQHNPLIRLGTGGAQEVKDHPYFFGLDWTNLLRQKAEFVPQLDNEEDTSYFDSKCLLNLPLKKLIFSSSESKLSFLFSSHGPLQA